MGSQHEVSNFTRHPLPRFWKTIQQNTLATWWFFRPLLSSKFSHAIIGPKWFFFNKNLRSRPMSKIMKRICLVFTSGCRPSMMRKPALFFFVEEKRTERNGGGRFCNAFCLQHETMKLDSSIYRVHVRHSKCASNLRHYKSKTLRNSFTCHKYLYGRASGTGEF